MKARLQKGGLAPAEEFDDLRTVVLYDDFEQPILIIQKLETGQILTTRCTDADFAKIATGLGIGLNSVYKACRT